VRKEVGYYEDFFLIKATHDEEGIVSFFSPHFASFYLLLFVSNRNITREFLGKPSSLSKTFLGSWFLGSLSFSDSGGHNKASSEVWGKFGNICPTYFYD
jgi:hypothetical protein